MKKIRRPFGKKSKVSLFTLGTMRAINSSEQMFNILKMALLIGINHIETSPAYGPAETFLGEAIKRLKEEGMQPINDWIITSKILPCIDILEGKNQLKGLLNRLGIKKLDNLAIHGINLPKHLEWILQGEGFELIRWAKEENLINQVGFSSHGSIKLIKEAITCNFFDFCSLHLHLLDPLRIPLANLALASDMGVMAISPADKGGHLHNPSPTLIQDCLPIEPLELAYRYLIANGISTLTVGASKPEDLKLAKKLINANWPLKKNEEQAIKNLQDNRAERLEGTLCNQCQKCLPCPNEVPISGILRLRNLDIGHSLSTFAKERYNLIGKAGHWWEQVNASACENCNDCIPRCPYNLNIPYLLKDTHKRLAAAPQRRLWG